MSPNGSRRARFGVFDIDLVAREIRKHGTRIRLQGQPFDVLCVLIERQGELVTREELRDRLWPKDTFVDFDQSLNKAVNKLRETLGDSASKPVYIETLARRGYRFLVPVEVQESGSLEAEAAALVGREPPPNPVVKSRPPHHGRWWRALVASGIIILAFALGTGLWPIDMPRVVKVVQLTHDGVNKWFLYSDGIRVMYGDTLAVWSVPASGGEPTKLRLPFVASRDAFVIPCDYSPVRQQALFWTMTHGPGIRGPGELWLTGPEGEAPRKVGEFAGIDGRFALSPQADRLAITLPDGVYIQSIATGQRRKIRPMTWNVPVFLWWHPLGDRIGFLGSAEGDPKTRFWQLSDDGGRVSRIVPEREEAPGTPGRWSLDGKRFYYVEDGEVFLRADANILGWLRRSEVTRLTTSGQFAPDQLRWPAVDPVDPKRLFVPEISARAETLRYDRKAQRWVPFLPGFSGEQIDRSPDGQFLVYVKYPGGELRKCRTDGSGDLLLVSGVTPCNPRWSPDGARIAFAGRRSGTHEGLRLWLVSASGGDAAPYRSEIDVGYDTIWSRDGKRILFGQGRLPSGENRIKILDLETGTIQPVPKSGPLFSPRWSPDEKRVIALQQDVGQAHIFDSAKNEWHRLEHASGNYPTWSQDGRWIYFFDEPSKVAFRFEIATGRREEVVRPDFPIASTWGAA